MDNTQELFERTKKRFLKNVPTTEYGKECVEWTGGIDMPRSGGYRKGYGLFNLSTKNSRPDKRIMAHRFSYYMYYGAFDESMLICHRCDNPPCINPLHLFAATAKGNADDMLEKGRGPWAARKELWVTGSHRKMDWALIEWVFKQWNSGLKDFQIARIAGVSTRAVRQVLSGETYRGVVARLKLEKTR